MVGAKTVSALISNAFSIQSPRKLLSCRLQHSTGQMPGVLDLLEQMVHKIRMGNTHRRQCFMVLTDSH